MSKVPVVIRSALFLLLFLSLVGCSASKVQPAPVQESTAGRQSSPLQQFIDSARAGDSVSLKDTRFGDIRILISRVYYSASGKSCKLAEVVTGTSCEVELAFCRREDGTWVETPPLWDSCVK